MDLTFRSALVTGAAGFIGSHLVDALVRAGTRTTVLDDLSGGSRGNLPDGIELIEADVADAATADLVARTRADLVIHAAAQVSVSRSVAEPDRDEAVNVTGTRHVLDGAREGGARRFVFISSGGAVYGEADGADEWTPPRPESPYGASKLAAEELVRASGLSWATIRFSNVYGPRQRADLEGGVVAIFTDALRAGRPVTIHGDGEQVRDLLYVADAVSGTLAAAMAAAPAPDAAFRDGTWNVATGVATSINGLLRELEAILGPAAAVVRAPRRAGDVRISRLSVGRIARELGWRPAWSLADGLRDLAGWSGR
jgi:UDP-glucose 4-epimerase